jgi:hypothetical protein
LVEGTENQDELTVDRQSWVAQLKLIILLPQPVEVVVEAVAVVAVVAVHWEPVPTE